MKSIRPLLQQASVMGMLLGLLMLSGWGFRSNLSERPPLILAALVLLASLAGFLGAAFSSMSSLRSDLLTRRGAKAGLLAAVTAAVCFVLMVRAVPGASPLRALITAGACIMPAALAGTIAAGLAVAVFRRKGIPEGAEPPPEFSVWGRWVPRCLLGLGIVAAMLSPLFPTAPLRTEMKTDTAAAAFRYTMPEAMKTAPPSAWKVATTRNLGRLLVHGLALSKDQKFLAGLESSQSIVIHEVDTDAVERLPMLPHPVSAVSFSPDGTRLFVVMEATTDGPLRLAVVERESGKITPLPKPKKHAVPKCPVDWVKPDLVGFNVTGSMWTLDLSSLEFEMDVLTGEETQRVKRSGLGLPSNDRWSFHVENRVISAETPETEGTVPNWVLPTQQVLTLRDEQRASVRAFPEISFAMNRDAPLFGVADGSKIIRLDGGMAEVIYFETRPVPPLRWKITMPHGPEKLRDHEAVADALANGQLGLMLYPPLTNPLTGKTIGPDREHPKARLGVLNWTGTEAEVWVCFDVYPFATGDVLADLFLPGDPHLNLLSFPQPHRWWTIAPEPAADAADVSKLPTRDELKKRRTNAEAKARAAEQATKAEPTKTPPKSPSETIPSPPIANPSTSSNTSTPQPANGLPGSRDDVIAFMGERSNREGIQGGVTPKQLLEAEVANFIFAHHQKASAGDVPGMVSDYAERVNFFGKPGTTREAISKEEADYHRKLTTHREVLDGLVEFTQITQNRASAYYDLVVYSVNTSGKATEISTHVRLELERLAEGWRIISHISESKK